MRPRGELRMALVGAAPMQGEGGMSWPALAQVAQVGLDAARSTVMNALRAGELVVVGDEPQPMGRPRKLFARPVEPAANADDAGLELARCWANFR